MTTYKGYEMLNGDTLEVRTNAGAAPRYFHNEKEIPVTEYWRLLNQDWYERVESYHNSVWSTMASFFGIKK